MPGTTTRQVFWRQGYTKLTFNKFLCLDTVTLIITIGNAAFFVLCLEIAMRRGMTSIYIRILDRYKEWKGRLIVYYLFWWAIDVIFKWIVTCCTWNCYKWYRRNAVKRCKQNTARRIDHAVQYIPRNLHAVFALLCFVVVIHWLIFPYPPGLLHWHCGNLTIAPVPAKQPWWIWINTSCEFIMNDCITTTKQSTTKPCAYFLGYTVRHLDTDAKYSCDIL